MAIEAVAAAATQYSVSMTETNAAAVETRGCVFRRSLDLTLRQPAARLANLN
jgi:hypothetical protein